MRWYWKAFLLGSLTGYWFFKSRNKVETNKGRAKTNRKRVYKLLVVPKVTTRLKVLQARDRVFKSKDALRDIGFRSDEAMPVVTSKSRDELKLSHFDFDNDGDQRIKKLLGDEVWTDIGMMDSDQVENYYSFLERFRSIVEDKSLSISEMQQQIQDLNDPYKFMPRLKDEYGDDFPVSLFVEQLVKVDGVDRRIAKNLIEQGIYTSQSLKNLSEDELLSIKGIGPKKMEKIRTPR